MARFGGPALPEPDGTVPMGHQVYPLLDTESTTEPVPVYQPGGQPSERKTEQDRSPTEPARRTNDKKKWWQF